MTTSKPFAQANIQAHLQILSVGAAEASPTCLVITDRDRFMLNVGEGTQRLAMEHKVRLTRFDHIFLTALTPEALGGLPGMLLTMADCGKTAISIHGPVGLRALLRSTSHFMRREDLKIIIREYGTTGLAMQGPTLAMHALPLLPTLSPCTGAPEQQPPQLPAEHEQMEEQQNGKEPMAKRPRTATASPFSSASSPPIMAWVGLTASVLGKFDVVRARELGIPTGPLYGKLKAGHAVTLPDGRSIQPEEVVAPPTPGAIFGVIHLPDGGREGKKEGNGDCNTFSSLLALPHPKFWVEAALDTAAAMAAADTLHLTCMLHYTSAAVVHTPLYQEWMKSFGPSTTHILTALPSGTHQNPYRAARINNLRLHFLDPVIFPRAAAPSNIPSILPGKEEGEEGEEERLNVVWGKNLMKYQLLPENKKGVDELGVLEDVGKVEEEELRADAEFRQVMLPLPLTVQEEEMEGEEEQGDDEGVEEVEIVFLGTGSAIPSKYRNVSGIYLRIGGSGERRRRRRRKMGGGEGGDGGDAREEGDTAKGMLLDVGEGSLGQLANLYEGEALSRVLVNLKAIWISHPHADHHLGLMKVLVARRRAAASLFLPGGVPFPLLVLAPRPLLAWLREYRQWDPAVQWYCNDRGGEEDGMKGGKEEEYLVDVEHMTPFAFTFLKRELGLLNLTNVVVHHCPFAFGVVLDGVAGWRLVYSGDTRPCQRLVQAGKGATILIHEATFESGKAVDAVERKHSTVDEALDVARRMEAKTVILTHFSQRYPKFPVLPTGSELRVIVAFDLMTLRFRDVSRAAALLPMLQKLFPSEEEEVGEEVVLGEVGLGGGPK
ncbi:hypothetical protein VYU27_001055 [Nannochloropsis oceanica]